MFSFKQSKKCLCFAIVLVLLSVAQITDAAVPTISKTGVTPTSAPAGKIFNFSAVLTASLASGYVVKIDYGDGLVSMSCVAKDCSLSRSIQKMGVITYKIGIYNSANILQGSVSGGTYTVVKNTGKPPILSLSISPGKTAEVNNAYTITLKTRCSTF